MKKIEGVNILVVGDVMLDRYIVGDVDRISPEAPVPIVKVTDEYSTLGGCGNVVRNIKEVGASVCCLSAIGPNDIMSDTIFRKLMEIEATPLLVAGQEKATVKERIIAGERNIPMIRVDWETPTEIDHEEAIKLLENFRSVNAFDMIVISDYAKGMITKELMDYFRKFDTPVIVDPKPENISLYGEVFMMTPNEKEWDVIQNSSSFFPWDGAKYILITKGKDGMELQDFNQHWEIPAPKVHQVYNVSGAGDTVVAILSVCLSMGYSPVQAAKIANKCAGYVVTQPGTSMVPRDVFEKNLIKGE